MSLFERGLVHVYTGNGKGKTTAAMGLIVRCVGHDGKAAMVQFMKGWPFYGEIKGLSYLPNVELFRTGGDKCFRKGEHSDRDLKEAQRGLEIAEKCLTNPKHDLVVLDEINVAVDFGLLKISDVLDLISIKPVSYTHLEPSSLKASLLPATKGSSERFALVMMRRS